MFRLFDQKESQHISLSNDSSQTSNFNKFRSQMQKSARNDMIQPARMIAQRGIKFQF